MDTYIPLTERVKFQNRLEERGLTNLHDRKYHKLTEWIKLNDWFVKTTPKAKKVQVDDTDQDDNAAAADASAEAKVATGKEVRGI